MKKLITSFVVELGLIIESIYFLTHDMPTLGTILIIIAIIMGFILLIIASSMYKIESKMKQRRKEAEAEENLIREGKWKFPVDVFFEKLKKAGCISLSSAFEIAKAKSIADAILKENQISEKYYGIYDNETRLHSYLETGLKNDQENEKKEIARREREQYERDNLSFKAEPTEQQAAFMQYVSNLSTTYGLEKRESMLSQCLSKVSTRIYELKEGQEAIRQVGFILANSATQKKPQIGQLLVGLRAA